MTDDGSGHRRSDRIYLGGFEIYRDHGSDEVKLEHTTLHVMDDKRRVALVELSGDTTTIRYQYDNNIGSACLELDEAAAVITYEEVLSLRQHVLPGRTIDRRGQPQALSVHRQGA